MSPVPIPSDWYVNYKCTNQESVPVFLFFTTKIGFFHQRMHKMCCALLLPYQIEERKEIRKKKAKQKTGSENTEDHGTYIRW